MGAEFTFKSGVKTLDVKNEKGEVLKTLSINVGDKEQIKNWLNGIQEVEVLSSKLTGGNVEVLDKLEEVEKSVVSTILGADVWTDLWSISGHNVWGMLGFITYLSKFLNESMEGFYKEYV